MGVALDRMVVCRCALQQTDMGYLTLRFVLIVWKSLVVFQMAMVLVEFVLESFG